MEYIFRTIESKSLIFIYNEIKSLSTSRDVLKELGEPLIVEDGQEWIFVYEKDFLAGFCAYKYDKILYFYTLPKYRNKGVFNILFYSLPHDVEWKVVSSNMSLPIFIKKGFEVVKSYKTCHKLKRNGKY